MGKYIHLFDTEEIFYQVYNGNGYLEPWVSLIDSIERIDYNKESGSEPEPEPTDQTTEYLTFDVVTGGDILWKGSNKTIEYSKNDGEWTSITNSTSGTPISVSPNDVVKFRGNSQYGYPGNSFGSNGATFKLKGNIMSLITSSGFENATSLVGGAHFNGLFYNCIGIIDASNLVLPATTLSPSCYTEMFQGCRNMVKGPKVLPATTLVVNCYAAMFRGCWSLTAATVICGETMAMSCCANMFERCSSITVTQAVLPATTLAEKCYYDMFDHCESLETAPVVPATTLSGQCCYGMFQHCFNMKHVQSALPATTLAEGCYANMFADNHILEVAPILPATTLVPTCYHSMFCDCWSLNYVKAMFITTPSVDYCEGWLYSIEERAPGTFVMNSEATWLNSVVRGSTTIPPEWTVQTAAS